MTIKKLVDLFLQEEQKTINSLRKEKSNIVKVINQIKNKTQRGGRVIYLGSGTSGRLGVLDALECKPTFNTDSFLGIIAGGKSAVFKAQEGVEDSTRKAIYDLKKLNLNKEDVVVGISASGETPYTVSGIKYAKKCRTLTVGISSNPNSTLSKVSNYKIAPNLGEEIILGSTRLKSGTAQKIILNMLSSITMIKSGKVFNNLMIDVRTTNNKLTKRAIGIISSVCNISFSKASRLFKRARKNTKAAIVLYFKRCSLKAAESLLRKKDFNLRKIISIGK